MQAELIKSYLKSYLEVRDKLVLITSEKLEIPKENVDLFSYDYIRYYLDELELVEFCMNIEEEFDIEIPDDVWNTMGTLNDILIYLLKVRHDAYADLDTIKSLNQQIKCLKVFNFLEKNSLNQKILADIIKHPSFTSQYTLLEKFITTANFQGLKINEIAEFSDIIRDDFLMVNLEKIHKILVFLSISNILKDEVLSLINEGYIEDCSNQIKSRKNSIVQKQLDIQNKNNKLQDLISEIDLMKQEVESMEKEFNFLTREI